MFLFQTKWLVRIAFKQKSKLEQTVPTKTTFHPCFIHREKNLHIFPHPLSWVSHHLYELLLMDKIRRNSWYRMYEYPRWIDEPVRPSPVHVWRRKHGNSNQLEPTSVSTLTSLKPTTPGSGAEWGEVRRARCSKVLWRSSTEAFEENQHFFENKIVVHFFDS